MPYFLLREIRTENFAKLHFALRSAKFAFREISVHCNIEPMELRFTKNDTPIVAKAVS